MEPVFAQLLEYLPIRYRRFKTMPPATPTSHDLARWLVEREPVRDDPPDPAARVHDACERLYGELRRWVGALGCQALFTRALLRAREEHAALAGIHVRPDAQQHLDGIAEAARTAGSGTTAAALQALLEELIELLGRFIGDDMVANLLERSVPGSYADESLTGRREASR